MEGHRLKGVVFYNCSANSCSLIFLSTFNCHAFSLYYYYYHHIVLLPISPSSLFLSFVASFLIPAKKTKTKKKSHLGQKSCSFIKMHSFDQRMVFYWISKGCATQLVEVINLKLLFSFHHNQLQWSTVDSKKRCS